MVTQAGIEKDLNVAVESPSKWGRVLTLTFPRRHYAETYDRLARDFRKRIVRPGFRKGHVPREIVDKEFGEQLKAETLEKLIPQAVGQAIEREELDVVSTPNVRTLDVDHPDEVRLEVEVEIRPELGEIIGLDDLRGEKWQAEVWDEDIEKTLENIQNEHGELVGVDRPAQDGDFVLVSYMPLDDAGNPQEAQKVENYPFELGKGQVVPEFEEAVRGLGPGQESRAKVQYADDHQDKELAGKLVAFVLTVKEVKEKRLPEIDDEFAKDLEFEGLDALKAKIREDLQRRLEEEAEKELRENLYSKLVEANAFDVPPSMVERYLEVVLKDYDQRHQQMRITPDPEKRQEYRKSAAPAAELAIRRILILEEIKKEHDLTSSEEDVDKWIEEKVQADDSEAGKIRAFFSDPKRRSRLRDELTDERVWDFVKSRATVTEVPRPKSQAPR